MVAVRRRMGDRDGQRHFVTAGSSLVFTVCDDRK